MTVGDFPTAIAAEPGGNYVYVANGSDDTVSIISVATNEVVKTIGVGNRPGGVTAEPGGNYVYVSNREDNTVSIISVTTNEVVKTIGVGNWAFGMAAEPGGNYVYVANGEDGTVSIISVATNEVLKTVNVGLAPSQIAAEPNGQYVYVSNYDSDTVSVIQVRPPGDEGGLCFIATACYGSPMAEEVKTLCRFRDEIMVRYAPGRKFVDFYYAHGPKLAELISDKPVLKQMIRFMLKPIVKIADISTEQKYDG